MLFFVARGVFGKIGANLAQWDFLQDFVDWPRGLQEALEVNQFLHIGMKVGFLFDTFANLKKELFIHKLLDAANGEVWYEVLTVAEVAQVVEGIQEVGFEVKQGLGLVVHAEPKNTRYIVAAEESRAVKVHGEGLVFFRHFLTGLDDVGDILCWGIADKLQGQMDLVGFHIVDILLMLKVFLQSIDHGRKFRAAWDGNGEEGSFCVHYSKNLNAKISFFFPIQQNSVFSPIQQNLRL